MLTCRMYQNSSHQLWQEFLKDAQEIKWTKTFWQEAAKVAANTPSYKVKLESQNFFLFIEKLLIGTVWDSFTDATEQQLHN